MGFRSLFGAILVVAACSEPFEVGFNSPSGGTSAGGSGGAVAEGGRSGAPNHLAGAATVCVPVECRGKTYECGNCDDDDGDGKIDASDADCLGPCDDSEDVFASDKAGGGACQQDCYFDRNSGAGNDCTWSHVCD